MKKWGLALVANCLWVAQVTALELLLDKRIYKAGETIQVEVKDAQNMHNSAWLGVIPSGVPHGDVQVNDQHDIAYEYLRGKANVAFTFAAPSKAGSYDIRLNSKEWDGEEVAYISFNVESVDSSKITLSIKDETVSFGKPIEVSYSSPHALPERAWIAIVPSEIPHGDGNLIDSHDLGYQYTGDQPKGTVILQAPSKAGRYDIRLVDNDPNGMELKSISISVKAPSVDGVKLTLNKNELGPGEEIDVAYLAHKDFSPQAWVGLLPAEVEHGDAAHNDAYDIDWRSIGGSLQGTLTFRVPEQKGNYDFRMHDSYTGQEVASASFQVSHSLDSKHIAEALNKAGKIVLRGIYFDSDKASLRKESHALLNEIVNALIADKSLAIRIEGHTDSQGDENYNLTLSQERALSVKSYLLASADIGPHRLETKGLGESAPVEDNSSDYGRSMNRRVELINRNFATKN